MSNITKLYTDEQLNTAIDRADLAERETGAPEEIANADTEILYANRQTRNAPSEGLIGTAVGIRIGLALAEIFAEEENQRVDSCAEEVFSAEDGRRLRNKLPSLSRYD